MGDWSVCAIGYGGSACKGVKAALEGTHNEKFTEIFSKAVLKQFEDLTSELPTLPAISQQFAMAEAFRGETYSPSAAGGIQNSGQGYTL